MERRILYHSTSEHIYFSLDPMMINSIITFTVRISHTAARILNENDWNTTYFDPVSETGWGAFFGEAGNILFEAKRGGERDEKTRRAGDATQFLEIPRV